MDNRYEAYASADPIFYGPPRPRGAQEEFTAVSRPVGDAGLRRCLEGLGALPTGHRGPCVLSDLRRGDDPSCLRYGGFSERHCHDDAGRRVPALEDPDGRLVPDVRGPGFSVPDRAPVPEFVEAAVAERTAPQAPELPCTVERVLRFSDAGVVHPGRKDPDGPQVVPKEARPRAGLDQRGVDAVTRPQQEHDMTARPAGLPGAPALHEPPAQLSALDPGKGTEPVDVIERRFPVPPGHTAEIRRLLAPSPSDGRTPLPEPGPLRTETQALLSGPTADWSAVRDSLAAGIRAMATPHRDDRLFPGDIAQFTRGSLGLAHGAAGVLYALHVTGAGTDAEHVRWLVDAARTRPARPGLYTGGHGVAYTLDLLGEREAALELLRRITDTAPDSPPGPDLSSGRAGIALALLHFAGATNDSRLLDTALVHALASADELEKEGPSSGRRKAGLMSGASGAALALVRLHESTGDHALLERAETLLQLDLERCVTAADGTVRVLDGYQLLPYVETGSAGIGLTLNALLTHHPDSPTARYRTPIGRAAEPEFIIRPGLFNGRAGLLGYLALTRPRPHLPDARNARHSVHGMDGMDGMDGTDAAVHRQTALDRHRRLLALHQISYQGHLAFPGDRLLRLSADLATGSAGVLLALGTALAGTPFLPWTSGAGRAITGS